MLRSDAVTKGIQRSPNRAMLRAVGFGDEDFGKPIIGIANGFSRSISSSITCSPIQSLLNLHFF